MAPYKSIFWVTFDPFCRRQPQGQKPHSCTRFRVVSHNAQFVVLENADSVNHHIGFNRDGSLRNAKATGRNDPAHFAVKVIVSISVKDIKI